jgi:hypothetical protein
MSEQWKRAWKSLACGGWSVVGKGCPAATAAAAVAAVVVAAAACTLPNSTAAVNVIGAGGASLSEWPLGGCPAAAACALPNSTAAANVTGAGGALLSRWPSGGLSVPAAACACCM